MFASKLVMGADLDTCLALRSIHLQYRKVAKERERESERHADRKRETESERVSDR